MAPARPGLKRAPVDEGARRLPALGSRARSAARPPGRAGRPHLDSLSGRRVLDVGCGNGYYGWRMLEAGATAVFGVDPTLVFCMQHLAVSRYLSGAANWVLPLRFEQLPPHPFDTVFSMGVIYHRRDPAEHARRL